jgi:hypothetical protein
MFFNLVAVFSFIDFQTKMKIQQMVKCIVKSEEYNLPNFV